MGRALSVRLTSQERGVRKSRALPTDEWRRAVGTSFRRQNPLSRLKPVSLSEGEKKEFSIEERRVAHLDKVAKVCVLDQTGRRWQVPWPSSKQLAHQTRHGELDRIEEEGSHRTCKVVGYYLKDNFYILAHWNKEPSNKSSFTGRTFRFDRKDAYARKLEDIRSDLLPKLMAGKIEEIT